MYTSLAKVFYKNPDDYETIYLSRYNSENSEHLYFSYIEPSPFFMYTKEITHLLSDIHKLNTEIILSIERLPGVAISAFTRKSLVEEIFQTNEIEGVRSTRKEITNILDKPSVRKRFSGIVNKYLKLDQSNSIKTCQDIRTIYNEIVYEEIKEENEKSLPDGDIFRKDSVSIYSATNTEIHKGLYPESKIIGAMTEALNILNSTDIDSLIAVAIFHYLFGYIHPFYDGNGRTGRFISSCYLTQILNPLIGYRLSYTIKKNQKKYYDAFDVTNNKNSKGDLTIFIISFLEILQASMENLNTALQVRKESLDYYSSVLEKIVKKHIDKKKESNYISQILFLLAQVELFSKDGITISEISNHISLNSQSIKKLMENNIVTNFIKIDKSRKAYRYSINLDALNKESDKSLSHM